MNKAKSLIIGTANFSNKYGVFKNNELNLKQINSIFNIINKKKITYIDTAISYINCDKILGNYKLDDLNIISKLGFYSDKKISEKTLLKKINQTMLNLNKNKLYALLLHSPLESIQYKKDIYINFLNSLKENDLSSKIGVSVYNPEDLKICFNELNLDVVQIPINIFDNRFEYTGWLDKLKKNDIEIHARSIFLQGLINNYKWPKYFEKWTKKINFFYNEISKLNITPTEAAISYVNNIKQIDSVVLGVNDPNQILKYLDINISENHLENISDACSIDDENFYNPSKWIK